jgi:N12 class adenine-specific DNA methylase
MAFHSGNRLADNISAIRIALDFDGGELTQEQITILSNYAGFGGIKAVLYPPGPIEEWERLNASDVDLKLYPQVMQLHELLRSNLSDKEYKQAFGSLKNSVLTAFFTPEIIPDTIYSVLREIGLSPKSIYEPSAGAGVFIHRAMSFFDGVEKVNAVEKDILTGKVLNALLSGMKMPGAVQIKGLEETLPSEKSGSDLVISNIPFGNFAVHDPAFNKSGIASKIHNYFFAKGLDKLHDGGILAYLVTDAFLNSPSNNTARKYLFTSADLLAVAALPANLMKENANVEVGTHLLLVQKNNSKEVLSDAEASLLECVEQVNQFGKYHINAYLADNPALWVGDEVKEGTNAYGQATRVLWQSGEIEDIVAALKAILEKGILSFSRDRWDKIRFEPAGKQLGQFTFLPVPEEKTGQTLGQLGLFDAAPVGNKALAYLDDLDNAQVDANSARLISTIRTTTKPSHDSLVLVTARVLSGGRYIYRLYSNVAEITPAVKWHNGQQLAQELNALSAKLRQFAYDYRYEGDTTLEAAFRLMPDRPKAFTDIKPYYEKDTLVFFEGQIGLIGEPTGYEAPFKPLTDQPDVAFYGDYIPLRDTYLQLSGYENEHRIEFPELRKGLNFYYDAFVGRYGELNKNSNRAKILLDAAFGFRILSSIEVRQEDRFKRSDIFDGPVFPTKEVFKTDDPVEALAVCLNDIGRVDLGRIAIATGLSEDEVISRLDGQILLNPQTSAWETVDNYLSGNVVAKLRIAERFAGSDPENLQFARSLAAVRRVQPEKIPFELLDFNLGERWVPLNYYERFATELFKLETKVSYFSSVDTFKVSYGRGNTVTNEEFAVVPKQSNKVTGHTLLEHALENTSPHFTYTVEENEKVIRLPDTDAIQNAHRKIETIRERYIEWLFGLPAEDKQTLEKIYNDTFNCFVLREYDGSHLKFPGLDRKALGISDLYSSQKNAAWRIIQNRGALIDHEVGLGKTLTMIVAAMEMKRLGIVHKPMILALKANVSQIAETFRKAYPKARVLAPGENDFEPAKRQRIFHEIKNNNWDCIILTHDQFGKIPQSNEIQQQIFEAELENIDRDLDTLRSLGGEVSKKMLKGLEIRKANLEGKLGIVLDAIANRKDTGINFQEMNVDHLFLDESHKFKNLTFTTRHNRVAGLGNMEGSQKALNMLFAIRTLQEKFNADLCATFLSGTPISNSLTEMYLIFKYLRPNEMERQRISNFDAWAAVFARKTVDFEFTVTNQIRAKERFRHFIKVPELALFYNQITDYKTAKQIALDKPEINEELIDIEPTPDQQEFTRRLMRFAETGNAEFIGRPPLTPEEDAARMLIATNYAKKMAVDMRLIDPEKYGDHPRNKVNVCARKVAKVYHQSSAYKGTQIIFSDIGTPKNGEFNVYDALRDKLVNDFEIPASEITFIHDWTDKKKKDLFRMMNDGQIRILLGSTDKAGTGLNVQKRVVAMHHLDIPWKPSELEQRDGRGARQGNWLAKEFYENKVKNYIYAVKMSLDNYKFNLLKNKQRFISQMKNSELSVRTIDEGAIDEQSGMNFSEYIAILSGDTSLLEKTRVERKIAELEGYKSVHFKEVSRSRYLLEDLEKKNVDTRNTLDLVRVDEKAYKEQLKYDGDGTKLNPIRLNGITTADAAVIGNRLIELYQKYAPESYSQPELLIGELYGFELYVRRKLTTVDTAFSSKIDFVTTLYAQSKETGIKYLQNGGAPNIDNPKLAARYFLSAIDRVIGLAEKYERDLVELDGKIPEIRKLTEKTFDKESELSTLKLELQRLESLISQKIHDKESRQEGEELFPETEQAEGQELIVPAARR